MDDARARIDAPPPPPVPGARARVDPLDHYQHEAERIRAEIEREQQTFRRLLAAVREELAAEAIGA